MLGYNVVWYVQGADGETEVPRQRPDLIKNTQLAVRTLQPLAPGFVLLIPLCPNSWMEQRGISR